MNVKSISEIAYSKPVFLIRLDDEESWRLRERLYGSSSINVAIKYDLVKKIKLPCIALILSDGDFISSTTYAGMVSRKTSLTTFDSRISVDQIQEIEHYEPSDLVELIKDKRIKGLLATKIDSLSRAIQLSPRVSSSLVESLCQNKKNKKVLNNLSEKILERKSIRQHENVGLQMDAVSTALKIFGITTNSVAELCKVNDSGESVLSEFRVHEDSVIEDDARQVYDMALLESSATGRAIFRDSRRTLEVVTANKRPLEKVLGVDLIYINRTMNNVVLLQYKMLERKGSGIETRWIYRPDKQLKKELKRMHSFAKKRSGVEAGSYRLNDQAFYMKLIKRDSRETTASITLPLDHFEEELSNPDNVGSRGGVLIDYQSLEGRYLRTVPFTELVKHGYIGTRDAEIQAWSTLIDMLITGSRSVVVAIQKDLGQR